MHIQPFCTTNISISFFRWMLNMTLKLHTLHFWLITPTCCFQQTLQILSFWTISLVCMFKKTVVIRPQKVYRFTGKDSCKVRQSARKYPCLHMWKSICSNHNIYLLIFIFYFLMVWILWLSVNTGAELWERFHAAVYNLINSHFLSHIWTAPDLPGTEVTSYTL